jgi:DNA-binding PadR family transcriptional regulator
MGTDEPTIWSASNPVIIPFDNDKSGREGAEKLAKALKMKFQDMVVLVCDWKNLGKKYPRGADITDIEQADFIKLIETAVEHNIANIGEFKILTARQAMATKPEPIQYIVEGLLPYKANTLFAGETGSGKSYFALQLGLAVANNERDFLGFRILKKNIRVLYSDTECGLTLLHNRFRQVVKNFQPFTGENRFFMMSKVGRSGQIWEAIDNGVKTFKPDIVIVDCLYNTSSVNNRFVRFDKGYDLSTLTDKMTGLREQYKITVIAVHHFNKGNEQDGLIVSRIQGATPLLNWAEHISGIINTTADQSIRLFRIMKSRTAHGGNHYFKLIWDAEHHKFINEGVLLRYLQYLINSNKILEWEKFLTEIREVADKDGRFETKDALNIGENPPFSKSRVTIHRWLKQLEHNGFIESLGHGIWRLTGLQVADDLPDDDDAV